MFDMLVRAARGGAGPTWSLNPLADRQITEAG